MVSIGKWLILGLAGAFALSALIDPARAQGTVSAFGGIGTALGSLGSGVQSLLTGTGTGVAKLFNPLFTLRDLIYGPQAGVQVQSDIEQVTSTGNLQASQIAAQQQAIELDPAAPFTPVNTGFGGVPLLDVSPLFNISPSVLPTQVAQFGGIDTSYGWGFGPSSQVTVNPPLSIGGGENLAGANLASLEGQTLAGVLQASNTFNNPSTVASQNSSNASSNSSASANYTSGAAQAAGYSTGRPRHS